MTVVWKWLARAASAALMIGLPASVQAIDRYDAWINVFDQKTFLVMEVINKTEYVGGSQIDLQTIRGIESANQVIFQLQRVYGNSATLAAFDSSLIDSAASSQRSMAQRLRLPENEITAYAKIAGRNGRGATVDARNCRHAWFGIRGTASSTGFQFLVTAQSCGDKDAFTRYLQDQIAPSDRAANQAAAGPGTPDPSPALQIQRSRLKSDCEAAKGDNTKLAAFIQSLNRRQLTQFLASKQDCSSFLTAI